jgi:hypothetical protein
MVQEEYPTLGETFQIMDRLNTIVRSTDAMEKRLESVEDSVVELGRTIRGHNGTEGLVTKMAVLSTSVDIVVKNDLEREKQLCELADSVNEIKAELGIISVTHKKDEESKDKIGSVIESSKKMPWYVDKIFSPVIVAIVLWFLFTLIPHINAP